MARFLDRFAAETAHYGQDFGGQVLCLPPDHWAGHGIRSGTPTGLWFPPVVAAISLRRLAGILAVFGIAAKVTLFEWITHTANWTAGTRILAYITVAVGLLTMVLSVIEFGRSRPRWAALLFFILGFATFAPVLGYSA